MAPGTSGERGEETMDRREFVRVAGAGAGLGLVHGVAGPAARDAAAAAGPGDDPEPLPTRTLGATGERVPVLGFGTSALGRGVDDEEAVPLIHRALDLGVTYLDTAPDFAGYGRAQRQIGVVMEERRDEAFLVTKCWVPGGDEARRLLERNLEELRTDHVDLVHAHSLGADKMDPDIVLADDGVIRALLRAKEEGLARYVGISGHNRPHRFVTALERFPVDVMMTAVNFADRHIYGFEEKVWPAARERDVGLVAMKVFGGPRGGITPARMGADLHGAALRYALSLEGCATAVVGMVSGEELAENVERARAFTPLTPAERRELLAVGRELAPGWGPRFGAVE